MKRVAILSVFLFLVASFAFAGGQQAEGAAPGAVGAELTRIEFDPSSPTGGQVVPPTEEVYSFDFMVPDGEHWPGDGLWESIILEELNLDIEVKAHPWSGYADKLKLFMVSDSLPEVVFTNGVDPNALDEFGMGGGLVSYTDWIDILPNIRKTFFEDYPEVLPDLSATDGEMYRLAHWGTYAPLGISGATWHYREDVLQKFGIEPTFDTYEDLYQVAKQLKEAAPDTYPIGTRAFRNMLGASSWGWGTGPMFGWNARYYDPETDTWKYAAFDPGLKDMIMYFNKLYEEDLLHPEILTMNSSQFFGFWSEPETYKGIALWAGETPTWEMSFNGEHPSYPGIVTRWMEPPIADVEGANAMYQNGRVSCWSVNRGHIVNAKAKNPEVLLRWLDYWYSEEGKFFSSWGKEGVTFDWYQHPKYGRIPIPHGDDPSTYANENEFYTNYVQKVQWGVGFGGWGPNAFSDKFQSGPPYMAEVKRDIQAAAGEYMYGPAPRVFLGGLELEMVSTKEADLNTYFSENISEFVIGKKPFSEWDAFVQGCRDRDAELVIDIYNRAWNNTKETLGL